MIQPRTIDVPLGDKPYVTAYVSIGLEICQNFYLERSTSQNTKAQYFFVKIPGLTRIREAVTQAPCRMLFATSGGKIFGVWGTQFAEVDSSGNYTVRGTLITASGVVNVTENGFQMLVVDGTAGYIYDLVAGTWERITESTFPGNSPGTSGPTHCICIDTYFLVNLPGTNSYQWSNPGYQSTTVTNYPTPGDKEYVAGLGSYWDGLSAGQGFKLGKPDQILSVIECANQAWLFGANSIEVHYDTGNYPEIWARYEGAMFEMGIAAKNSACKWGTQVFWLATDKSGVVGVFTNQGYAPKRISERGVEQHIGVMPRYDDAVGYMLSQNGHTFYVLQFPTADKTWVYDLTTETWTERTYLLASDGTLHAWRGMFSVYSISDSKNLLADRSSDALYWSNPLAYANDDDTGSGWNYIQCVKTTPLEFQLGTLVRYNWAQVLVQQGVGRQLNTGAGVGKNPVLRLAFSNDCGVIWSSERILPIGQQGQYQTITRANVLASARNRMWRISLTDPVPFILSGLLVNITPGLR